MEWIRWSKEKLSYEAKMSNDVVGADVSINGDEISEDEVSRVGLTLEVIVMILGLMVVCNDRIVGPGLKIL